MKKTLNIIYLLLLFCIITIPLLLTNTEERVESELDNRFLTEFPMVDSDSFKSDFESYLRDRIGFRREMINAYTVFNYVVANEIIHPSYTYGKDDYIFPNMHENIHFSDYHKDFSEMVLKIQRYCESRNKLFYFMIEPEKQAVYKQYLPTGVNYDDSWVDEMTDYMKSLGINCIDNTEVLVDAAKNEFVFNKKYDANHWNDLGCFYATENLVNTINEDLPEVPILSKDEFEVTTEIEETLPLSDFRVDETVPRFDPKVKYIDKTSNYSDEIARSLQHNHFKYYQNLSDNASELPTILMFQGSYYNGREKFLIGKADKYISVHNYENIFDLPYYFNIFEPDIVILEVAEYTLTDAFFDSEEMKSINWNQGVSSILKDDNIPEIEGQDSGISLNIMRGKNLIYLYLSRYVENIKNAYLMIDDNAYDLQTSDTGTLYTYLQRNVSTDNCKIVFRNKNEEVQKYLINVNEVEADKGEIIFVTPDITFNEQKTEFAVQTSIKNSIFNSVDLQLLNTNGEYIATIETADTVGIKSGSFYNTETDSEYILRIKANSNIQNSFVDYAVDLKKGDVYGFSFNIDRLDSKNVVFSNLSLYY